MCNQNAAFAESLAFNEPLVQFYHRRGINIVAWNYRGCSLSSGAPSVAAIKKDAASVAHWLRAKIPDGKILVHGTSMGGACACHLGRLGLCDFLLADRTFGDLHSVPASSMGWWASIGLRVLFEFDSDSSQDYFYAKCYKVLAQDPLDSIIQESCSLKTKVAALYWD